ncbi:hypothetical protein BX616_005046 [Lobosporangium transversale]|uniref:Amidohydrolase-related domain-containing protein n=1 Tax=Lobosporangium transversale TaxID=64571 RepID=A0A1Y2GSY3_9FUNG|nr:hypothetical protein BCR41DRAFT_385332 [Lobosporangium transversale]KAF9897752.1 hypothetical protein BX616_005046 [Lobosporangium transversale]ORZ21931.1 hypothetical protein BCR41DRAFT_385332 [Lobosporangium transversale]|eukprot:XP_021883182.1 hypothetical protein BCR41DRAFT_385332 [Lobosporangium transversale]
MCQGAVPEYFKFKEAPPELPPGWLGSRFLHELDVIDPHTQTKEYVVSKTAPCPIIDAHVHVFPQKLMDAVWTFFDNFYWPVRYKGTYLESRADFLIEHGVTHVVLLVYAHKNGIARDLNKYLAQVVNDMNTRYNKKFSKEEASGQIQKQKRRRVATGLATVMPGEPGAKDILAEAFTTLGLSGIKMHSHVQSVPANHPSMDEVYETCIRFNKPVLIHAGKAPNSSAYKVDAGKICDASIVEDVLKRYPRLRMCVPHLGMNQYEEFFDLLDRYPNFYLDTTMTFGSFFQTFEENKPLAELLRTMFLKHSDRILYGSDWPNIPYSWSREIANLVSLMDGDGDVISSAVAGGGNQKGIHRTAEGDTVLEKILWRNASRFYGISEEDLGLSDINSSGSQNSTPFPSNL